MRSAASLLVLDSSYLYTRVALVVAARPRARVRHLPREPFAHHVHLHRPSPASTPILRRTSRRHGYSYHDSTSAHSSAATRNISATVALVVADPRCRIARSGLGAAPPLDTANPTPSAVIDAEGDGVARARRAARSSSSSDPVESPPGRDEAGRFVHHDGDARTRRTRARMEEDADARVDVDAVVDARTRARVVMTRASGRVEAPARFFARRGEARRGEIARAATRSIVLQARREAR